MYLFPNYQLVYILGGGHSGSTLLDLIISSAEEVYSVGELAFLDQYIGSAPASYKLTMGRICSCGEHMDVCPFWKSVNIGVKENILKTECFSESFKILINILNPFEHHFRFQIRIGNNKRVYDKIAFTARNIKPNIKYILDSSKDPRRLYELIRDPTIPKRNIWVIHLVRDGRGYIHSFQSFKRKKQGLKVRSIPYYVVEWLLINFLACIMIKKYRLNAIPISYDMFCQNPKAYISQINQWLKISNTGSLEEINHTVRHNIHGNLMRFLKIDGIVHDLSWQKGMGEFKKRILTLLLFPFNKLWVYNKN
jgi:hypothetical protein